MVTKYGIKQVERECGRVFTVKELIRARDQLKTVLTQALENPAKLHRFGICFNWQDAGFNFKQGEAPAYRMVEYLSAGWKYSTGKGEPTNTPVPHDYKLGRWDEKNLYYRIHLMRYIIKRLNDIIRRKQIAEAKANGTSN